MSVMVALYCRDHHGVSPGPSVVAPRSGRAWTRQRRGLCADCESLVAYADQRVAECRFGRSKPACSRCAVHCFRHGMRQHIRAVMRYSGPRMIMRHPILALAHLIDTWREVRSKPADGGSGNDHAIR
jgi:hypothetical protein